LHAELPQTLGPSAARTERKSNGRAPQTLFSNTRLTCEREAARLRGTPPAHRAGGSALTLRRRGAARAYVSGAVLKNVDPLGLEEKAPVRQGSVTVHDGATGEITSRNGVPETRDMQYLEADTGEWHLNPGVRIGAPQPAPRQGPQPGARTSTVGTDKQYAESKVWSSAARPRRGEA
jgi:hypothetical protein